MINASMKNPLEMNDWIFLRPTQSESVLLQFGDIAVYDGNSFVDYWSVFS
jgi:D-serine deaminase-like pyridoxal phosphate-dependent protein